MNKPSVGSVCRAYPLGSKASRLSYVPVVYEVREGDPTPLNIYVTLLTLIRMAGGVYESQKLLKRYNSKGLEVKIFFNLDLFLTKCIRIILCESLYPKNVALGYFSIFEYPGQLGVIYDSHATNRSVP